MKKLAGFLAACLLVLIGSQSSVIAQTFTKGDIVEVYNTGGIGLRVRNAPCGDRIGNEPDGSIGIILEGPVYCVLEGTGYYWWRIRWSDGMQGWSAQNWLRKLSLPWITSASPSPSTIPPGGTVTLTYNVTNLDKEIGGAIAPLLGASIQLSGGGPVLSDPANDRKATIPPGSSSVSRPFVVPATAAPGTYDLLVSLVADVNNNGRIDPEDRTWDLKVFPRVLQVRVTCTYYIFPTSQSFSSAGGSGSVNVTAPSGCPWTATSNASWITITSGSSGNGNGTVNYSVASNPSTTPRTGTMTIAGQTFTVTQDPPLPGTIQVNATLNGATWSGSVSYRLTGPQTIDGTTVPATFSNRPTGSYTLNYQSGGPSGATLTSITPSATQTLNSGGTITFTLNFTTSQQNPVRLRAPWDSGQYWVPQTYDGHPQPGTWNAVDFYYATPQAPGVFGVTQESAEQGRGKNVRAAHDGIVSTQTLTFFCPSKGTTITQTNLIITSSDGTLRTHYIHLIINVTPGTQVRAGDIIGSVSNEGCANWPHLMFAVERNGSWVPLNDPNGVLLDGEVIFSGEQQSWVDNNGVRHYRYSSMPRAAAPRFTLTVNKTGSGQGTVTSSPSGIDCGPTCSADFTSGAVVTLTPTPATGSTFAGWSGACSGTGTCTVTMDADKTVTATFTSTVRPPAAPNQLRVRAVSSRRVDLSWNDRSNNEDGFRIYRNGSLIATVGANTTSYSDTTVRPRTRYCYQVAAYNAAGEARSSRVCTTTPQSFQLGTLMVAGILIGTAPNGIEFAIDGQGVSSAQVEVFDLKGRKVFDSGEVQDNTFTWDLQNNAGQRLANGVYLYVVRVRGFKGEVYVSEVRKLVIVR
jgi:hypothetical protein